MCDLVEDLQQNFDFFSINICEIPKVDDYEPMETSFNVKMSADAQFDNIEYLYIGKEEGADEGFVGCISRVEFNDFYPLKLLFQQNPPDNIKKSGTY